VPTYNVTLSRAYTVRVRARNARIARETVKIFLGNAADSSFEHLEARRRFGFRIEEMEMVDNNAFCVQGAPL